MALILMGGRGLAQPAPVEILFWHHEADDTRAAQWQSLADSFNVSQTEVKVTIQYYPSYHHQHDALLAGLVNGTVPDVALVRAYDAALYSLSGQVVDLNPLIAESNFNTDDFYPLFWEQDQHQGRQLGLPLTRAAETLYTNLTALRELGYDQPPATRAEWETLLCDFYESGGWSALQNRVGSVGMDIRWDASFWWGISAAPPELDFTTPEWRESLNFIQNMLRSGCVALTLTPPPSLQNRFASGQTLFYVDSSAARPYIQAAMGDFFAEPFELGVSPLPAEGGQVANWYGASVTLFKSDPVREAAAWAWMAWLAEPAQIALWEGFPARQGVPVAVEWATFAEATWRTEPHPLGYDLIRDEMSFALRGILAGEDPTTRLQSLTETANHIQTIFEISTP